MPLNPSIVFLVVVLLPFVGMVGVSGFGAVMRLYARRHRGRLEESLLDAGLLPECTLEDDVHWQVALRAGPSIEVSAFFVPDKGLQARLTLALDAPPLSILPREAGAPRPPLVAELRESEPLRTALAALRDQARGVELVVRDNQLVFRCRASSDVLQRADALVDDAIAPLLARLWRDRRRFRDDVTLCPWEQEPLVAKDTAPDDLFCPRCKRRALSPERVDHFLARTGNEVGDLRARAQRARRPRPCGFCGTHLSDVRADGAALSLCEGCGAIYGKARGVERITRVA